MATEITSTQELAEAEFDPNREPYEIPMQIVATREATNKPFEFHVSMHGFTMQEMDNLVIEAAARLIVGDRQNNRLAKAIEQKCIDLIDQKAESALSAVTDQIIDAPLMPAFGDKKPVTMREFIGLYGREYLTALVDADGKPTSDRGYGSRSTSRIEYLVQRTLDRKFAKEISEATNLLIHQVRRDIQARHAAILADEKKRLSDALAHTLKE